MGVRLTTAEHKTALYDSTNDTAFGPIFDDEDDANDFLDWIESGDAYQAAARNIPLDELPIPGFGTDARAYTAHVLQKLHSIWDSREPSDDQIYNRPGVEGGIAYPIGGDS